MRQRFLVGLTMGVMLLGWCLPGWCADEAKADAFDYAAETIGPLRLGLAAKDVLAAVPCPPDKGRELHEAATGDYVQTWKMPGCGLELKMGGPRKGGAKTVAAITVSAPSELATGRGIRIGSTEAEVQAAYGRFKDEEEATRPGETFVAGSIFGGLMIEFKDGRVTGLFLGAAAE